MENLDGEWKKIEYEMFAIVRKITLISDTKNILSHIYNTVYRHWQESILNTQWDIGT